MADAKKSDWIPIDEFRGEPNTSPMAWWWHEEGFIESDEVLLGEKGEVVGKGCCGADYCTHVRLVDGGELPEPPK